MSGIWISLIFLYFHFSSGRGISKKLLSSKHLPFHLAGHDNAQPIYLRHFSCFSKWNDSINPKPCHVLFSRAIICFHCKERIDHVLIVVTSVSRVISWTADMKDCGEEHVLLKSDYVMSFSSRLQFCVDSGLTSSFMTHFSLLVTLSSSDTYRLVTFWIPDVQTMLEYSVFNTSMQKLKPVIWLLPVLFKISPFLKRILFRITGSIEEKPKQIKHSRACESEVMILHHQNHVFKVVQRISNTGPVLCAPGLTYSLDSFLCGLSLFM